MAKMKENVARPTTPTEQKQKFQNMLDFLTTLQSAGDQEKDGVRTYDFELTPQGQTLLNGVDVTTLATKPPAKRSAP
jgi:hypothetical protein